MENMEIMRRPKHKAVTIDSGFWKEQLQKIHTVTVWDTLNKFEHDQQEGILKNYEWVIEGKTGMHIGPPWYDGLICEVIRGISDIISESYDEALDRKIEEYTAVMSAAQDKSPDGYLNTYVTLMCPDQQWGGNGGSLLWQHETYDLGALIEAGIHYYRATGKTALLKCGVKAANCMCGVMGPAPRKNIVPAHSLAEEALVKLCRLFREESALSAALIRDYGVESKPEEYLALAKFWMDHRGVHENRYSFPHYMGEYAQDHCPVTEQSEAVGHAVRAALMYTGLAAVGMETGEKSYLDAARRLWDNVVQTKLHISGGIGAVHNEERFGFQYDLPNDAYLETCAGVALAFWAGEMHRAFGDASYMDVLECALYNNVLPCLSVDGTHYFYENPLISDGTQERWDWHPCPCCPPMLLKLMGALPDYVYSFKEDGIYVNLHIGSSFRTEICGQSAVIKQIGCELPWKGENRIQLTLEKEAPFTLGIRVPAWAGTCSFAVNGETVTPVVQKGYALLKRVWKDGDEVSLEMELPAVKVQAHPFVDADAGRIALQRGPLLYCVEGLDNDNETDFLLGSTPLRVVETELFGTVKVIEAEDTNGVTRRAIPYFLWNNRGKGKMAVWLRQESLGGTEAYAQAGAFAAHAAASRPDKRNLEGWEGKLYRRYC